MERSSSSRQRCCRRRTTFLNTSDIFDVDCCFTSASKGTQGFPPGPGKFPNIELEPGSLGGPGSSHPTNRSGFHPPFGSSVSSQGGWPTANTGPMGSGWQDSSHSESVEEGKKRGREMVDRAAIKGFITRRRVANDANEVSALRRWSFWLQEAKGLALNVGEVYGGIVLRLCSPSWTVSRRPSPTGWLVYQRVVGGRGGC